jgi:hypothetical protein
VKVPPKQQMLLPLLELVFLVFTHIHSNKASSPYTYHEEHV